MTIRRIGRFASIASLAAAGALGLSAPVSADEYLLATSKTHKLQILADGGASWCGQNLKLRMVLEAGSPDTGNPASQIDMMNRLKSPITNDCKAAASADLTVVDSGKPGTAYRATAAGGWVFAAAPAGAADTQTAAMPPVAAPAAAASMPANTQTPAGVQSPAMAAPAKIEPLPQDMNYWSGLLRWVHDNPGIDQDDAILNLWAFHRYENEYRAARNDEFKLQPLLQRARTDLADALHQGNIERVTVAIHTELDSYDFAKQRFPLSLGDIHQVSYREPCCDFQKAPIDFVVTLEDLDILNGLPMDPAAAKKFTESRTRWGSVDRTVYIAVIVKLHDGGFQNNNLDQAVAPGSVDSAVFYADEQMKKPLFQVSAEDFARLREVRDAEKAAAAKAAAEHEAEQRRQQLMAQREQNIRDLTSLSPSIRLANFISAGDLNYRVSLDNLRNARSTALIGEKPVQVSMLVQADGNGRRDVATRWPGLLDVTSPGGQPEMKASGWYLVRGLLNVPNGNGLPAAQLMAEEIYACTQPKCADAADATAVVDRKLAGLSTQGGAQ